MHPAPSIIFFTVLSGLGLGLMIWIGLGLGPDDPAFRWLVSLATLFITAVGGVCSTLHLGRPANAIRAFTQWRSSWLSREACLMLVTMTVFFFYAVLWIFFDVRSLALGIVAAVLAFATIWSTAMIYGQLKTVPRWSRTPTPILFVTLALAGGLLAIEGLQAIVGTSVPVWPAFIAIVGSAGVTVWWQKAAEGASPASGGTSLETATGLGSIGKVRLFEAPHSGSNYLLKEMAFQVGRNRATQIRWLGLGLGFILPLLITALALYVGSWVILIALLCHVVGMLALRWLFFAEAEHVQALYYGKP